jgi:uncharacterized repeat protein (TIGR04138 family)
MSHKQKQQQLDWTTVLHKTGPYPIEAYNFVREGLSYTVERFHAQDEASCAADYDRHISGQELCLGLRDYAIDRYGMLAPVVLDHWHIRRTDDFGRIVFAMIDAGLMSKTEDDSPEDFRAVFNFGEAFSRDELVLRLCTG